MQISEKIPADINEAVESLFISLTAEDITYLKENGSEGTHFNAGTATRNGWQLWEPSSPLHIYFRDTIGLGHADDMSGILMETLARRVKGLPFDIEGQVKHYKDFWELRGIDPRTQARVGPDHSQEPV